MKATYGPVSSWRLGKSLGVDLICSEKKICSFDCIYCQLGKTKIKTTKRNNFVSIKDIKKDVKDSLKRTNPDVITLSGTGEPTLAKNMDLAIRTIRQTTKIPLAILTNSTLLNNKNVQKALFELDIVVAKLDAPNEKIFKEINQPVKEVSLKNTMNGIIDFKSKFSGKLDIQTMFLENNMNYANEIADIVCSIEPNEVQINTPLRPCAVKPLPKEQIEKIEKIFKERGLKTISVYSSKKPKTSPMDKIEIFKRRGIDN
jgi:wyosine [tRNA(Phe)-imidazoG37] synthetase (radical SAM superfamily)